MHEALPLHLAIYKRWPINYWLLVVVTRLEKNGPGTLCAESLRLSLRYLD
jgi:hypothetical protein